MSKVKVHGTYPFDEVNADHTMAWKTLRKISYQEAAKLVGIEIPKENCYLWLNKGFIVIGLEKETGDDGISNIQAAMGERFGDMLTPHIKPGMKAVYLADGKYLLIERVLPYEHSRPEVH